MKKTWDDIQDLLDVRIKTRTDTEWDEAKLNAIEATIYAIIERLRSEFPDPD